MTASAALKSSLKNVIDLDARRAQRDEARGEDYEVKLGGERFTFPAVTEWPIEITELLQRGDLMDALRMLLSEEQAARFFAQKPTMGDLNDLFEALGNRAGVGGLGNSSASARS